MFTTLDNYCRPGRPKVAVLFSIVTAVLAALDKGKEVGVDFGGVAYWVSLALAIVCWGWACVSWGRAWDKRREERSDAFFEELRAANEGRAPDEPPTQSRAEGLEGVYEKALDNISSDVISKIIGG
jgi:hypothetical protein